MTDTPELNVWREAVYTYGGLSIEGTESEAKAAAVIRSYGDQRYQAAIDDVVEWLNGNGPWPLMTSHASFLAHEITRRFGKGHR